MSDNYLKRMVRDMEVAKRKKISVVLRNGELVKGTINEVFDDCIVLSEYSIGNCMQDPEEVITVTLESIVAYTSMRKSSSFSTMKALSGSVID